MPNQLFSITVAMFVMATVGCHTAGFTPPGTHFGGHSTVSQVNGINCASGDEECLYWYRVSLYEQCERSAAQRQMAELGAGVALPVVAGIIQSATRNSAGYGGVRIRQYVQKSYTHCKTPPMPPTRRRYGP